MLLSAPEPLGPRHTLAPFQSGASSLDTWLKLRALKNQGAGGSRTYVLCDRATVVGYYALAAGVVASVNATGKLRRNMPDPVPVILLGRLAVDRAWQNQGIGRALVQDACRRAMQASEAIGVRGLLVRAISDQAKAFYESTGFMSSPLDPMLLMATLADLKAALR